MFAITTFVRNDYLSCQVRQSNPQLSKKVKVSRKYGGFTLINDDRYIAFRRHAETLEILSNQREG